jgi:hypothetical protein
MAGKRINSKAPLTAAEKQSRYRQKQQEEKQSERDEVTEGLRAALKAWINGQPYEKLLELAEYIFYGDKTVTLKELSEMSGLSIYELKKLESQGVISPVDPSDRPALNPDKEALKKFGREYAGRV